MPQNVVVPVFDVAPETVVGSTPQSVFDFDFPFWEAADIIVRIDGVRLDPTEYSVEGFLIQNGDPVEGGFGSGRVTLDSAVANVTVKIDRFVVGARETVFSRSVPLPMTALNADLNKLTARQQDLQRRNIETVAGAAEAAEAAVALQLANKADKTTSITGGGLATGGGSLASSRTITVPEATQVEAEAGTGSTQAMTPERATQHFNARTTAFTRSLLTSASASVLKAALSLDAVENKSAATILAELPEATPSASGRMSAADKTKLDTVATGATANATDAALRDRSTHTGAQAIATVTGLQTALDSKIPAAEKATANGVATLDAGGKIPTAQLPALALTETSVVASQAAMLALTAQPGDVAVRSDLNRSFILTADPASTLANWQELLTPTDAVLSVQGRGGAVTITKADVGLGNVEDKSAATILGELGNATPSASGRMSAADKSKLDGVASGATANASDADLRDRASHTGTQPASTISDLTAAIDARVGSVGIPDGGVSTAKLGGDITAAGKALLDDANAAAQRATLGLTIGTHVQAYDAATAKTDVAQTWAAGQSAPFWKVDTNFGLVANGDFPFWDQATNAFMVYDRLASTGKAVIDGVEVFTWSSTGLRSLGSPVATEGRANVFSQQQTFSNGWKVDSTFYAEIQDGTCIIGFDGLDFIAYNRAANKGFVKIGATEAFAWTEDGLRSLDSPVVTDARPFAITGGTRSQTLSDRLRVSMLASEVADPTGAVGCGAAIATLAAQSFVGEIVFGPGTYLVDANVTWPTGCTYRRLAGAIINVAAGVTLTINGDWDDREPLSQTFAFPGAGTGLVHGLRAVTLEMFGGVGDGNLSSLTAFTGTDIAGAWAKARACLEAAASNDSLAMPSLLIGPKDYVSDSDLFAEPLRSRPIRIVGAGINQSRIGMRSGSFGVAASRGKTDDERLAEWVLEGVHVIFPNTNASGEVVLGSTDADYLDGVIRSRVRNFAVSEGALKVSNCRLINGHNVIVRRIDPSSTRDGPCIIFQRVGGGEFCVDQEWDIEVVQTSTTEPAILYLNSGTAGDEYAAEAAIANIELTGTCYHHGPGIKVVMESATSTKRRLILDCHWDKLQIHGPAGAPANGGGFEAYLTGHVEVWNSRIDKVYFNNAAYAIQVFIGEAGGVFGQWQDFSATNCRFQYIYNRVVTLTGLQGGEVSGYAWECGHRDSTDTEYALLDQCQGTEIRLKGNLSGITDGSGVIFEGFATGIAVSGASTKAITLSGSFIGTTTAVSDTTGVPGAVVTTNTGLNL